MNTQKLTLLFIALVGMFASSTATAAGTFYTGSGNATGPYLVGQYFPGGGGTSNPTFLSNTSTPSSNLLKPYEVAVDAAGNVYVADFGHNQIGKYDALTHLYTQNFLSSITGAWGLAISGNTIYVGSYGSGTVAAYDLTTKAAAAGFTTITGLTNPTNLLLDGSGNLYVANYGADLVAKYSAAAGGTATDASFISFHHASGLAMDAAGNIYVSSDLTTTIGKYTIAGVSAGFNPSYITGTPQNVYGLAIDTAGYLYDTDYNHASISQYDIITSATNGTLINAGFITGISQVAGITFVPAAVPEPSSVALLCIGGAAFAGWRSRRKFRK